MKKTILAIILGIMSFIALSAKTTYIPTFYTQINISASSGVELADSTIARELAMSATDGRYSITVMHDSVTAERVKSIKRVKAAQGWALVSAAFSGASIGLNPMRDAWDATFYMQSVNNIASAGMLRVAAMTLADKLQQVDINIIVTNNTDREMVVNDMMRGLTWYIRPRDYVMLTVGNAEVNKLRIAYADCADQKIDYAVIQAANHLSKETIAYEDEACWVVPVYEHKTTFSHNDSSGDTLVEYTYINRITFERKTMTISEYKAFKDDIKKTAKAAPKEKKEKSQRSTEYDWPQEID